MGISHPLTEVKGLNTRYGDFSHSISIPICFGIKESGNGTFSDSISEKEQTPCSLDIGSIIGWSLTGPSRFL